MPGPFVDAVTRLSAYRGITELGALTLASEVGDWRRFGSAPAFMGFTGLVPSEYSSELSQHRGHLTKTGNAHLRTQLIESAWAYQHRPSVGSRLQQSHAGVPAATIARSCTGQQRLCARFRSMAARKNVRAVVVTANTVKVALRSDGPPKYERAVRGSIVDGVDRGSGSCCRRFRRCRRR